MKWFTLAGYWFFGVIVDEAHLSAVERRFVASRAATIVRCYNGEVLAVWSHDGDGEGHYTTIVDVPPPRVARGNVARRRNRGPVVRV